MFEWDDNKRWMNLLKHGVDFDAVWEMEWPSAIVDTDSRNDYGEVRYVALVPRKGRVHSCTFTLRDTNRRIISLRKANRREQKYYEKQKATYE